jgi:hypothetical protein
VPDTQDTPRHRSLSTTTVALILLGAAVLIPAIGYGVLAFWFFSRSPDIAVDHLAELNEGNHRLEESDRGAYAVMDIYSQFDAVLSRMATRWGHPSQSQIPPDSPDWWLTRYPRNIPADVVVDRDRERELLAEAAPVLEELREAAARPNLGWEWIADGPDSPMWDVLLPYLGPYRTAGAWLTADAQSAAAAGDADRATADLVAAANLARQLVLDDPFTISQIVGFSVLDTTSQTTLALLAGNAELFTAAQLGSLAEALTMPLEPTLDGERRFYHDTFQRVYAPGENGRITPDGLGLLLDTSGAWGVELGLPIPYADRLSPDAIMAIAPIIAPSMSTRGRSLATFDEILTEFRAAVAQPSVTQANWDRLNEATERAATAKGDPVVRFLLPTTGSVLDRLQHARTTRDAALFAIAAHRYRLETGRFPESADDLVPGHLNERPIDRFTGGPMQYRLTPDGPFIYVAGPDLDDDGGTPPPALQEVDKFMPSGLPVPDGDWILFPVESN